MRKFMREVTHHHNSSSSCESLCHTEEQHCQNTIIIIFYTFQNHHKKHHHIISSPHFMTIDIAMVNNISHQMNLQYDRLYVDGRCYGWSQTQGRVLEQAVGSVFVNLLFQSVSCFCQPSVFVNLLFL